MTDYAEELLELVGRAQSLETLHDALRVLRDLLPPGVSREEARGLRKQVTLLRARLRDAAEADRIGLMSATEAEAETKRFMRFSSDIARDVIRVAEPAGLNGATRTLSLALASRESSYGPGSNLRTGLFFLSYRRTDAADATGRIRERLIERFGDKSVFMDVDSIPLGVDFRAHVVSALAQSRACLAVVGRHWLTEAGEDGRRRLDDVDDPIRVEIETALRVGSLVVPILVSNAEMPLAEDLPETMRAFSFRNAIQCRPDPDFNTDVERLIKRLEEHLG